ncbi:MAG: hypothetical protein GWN29_03265 [Gammaproteobacteria bacterium]|nr:hypothetical protein [Gammaproteobacteria bacterium]
MVAPQIALIQRVLGICIECPPGLVDSSREQGIEVSIVGRQRRETTAADQRESPQAPHVYLRHDDLPAIVGQKTTAGYGDRRAFGRTDG